MAPADSVVGIDALLLRHDIQPSVALGCIVAGVPSLSIDEFSLHACRSDVVALLPDSGSVHPVLSHYRACKSQHSAMSALFIVPVSANPDWMPLLRGMTHYVRTHCLRAMTSPPRVRANLLCTMILLAHALVSSLVRLCLRLYALCTFANLISFLCSNRAPLVSMPPLSGILGRPLIL